MELYSWCSRQIHSVFLKIFTKQKKSHRVCNTVKSRPDVASKSEYFEDEWSVTKTECESENRQNARQHRADENTDLQVKISIMDIRQTISAVGT